MDTPKVTTPPDYYHRRADELLDQRLQTYEDLQKAQGRRLERLEARINYLFGALAILIAIANFIGPLIQKAILP